MSRVSVSILEAPQIHIVKREFGLSARLFERSQFFRSIPTPISAVGWVRFWVVPGRCVIGGISMLRDLRGHSAAPLHVCRNHRGEVWRFNGRGQFELDAVQHQILLGLLNELRDSSSAATSFASLS